MNVATKRDLISELLSAIPAGYSPADAQQRAQAVEYLRQNGLPQSKSEEYRFTPVTRLLEKSFESLTGLSAASEIRSISDYTVPGVEGTVIVLVNGHYSSSLSKVIAENDISITPLSQSGSKKPAGNVDITKDPFVALNAALWTEGVHINVSKGARIEKPVTLLFLHDASSPVSSHARLVVSVEEGAEVTIIERFESEGNAPVFNTMFGEITVAKEAVLNYYKIQNDSGNSIQVCNTFIHQSDGSHVNTFTLTMDGDLVRNNLTIAIDGENCESHFHGLYLLSDSTLADNHTVVDHLKPNSFSNEMYKGVMDDKSKGVFNGKIYVRPHAQKTNAFQSNRNVLLTDSATVNTKPQLEIWADDVKCSHGCTSGQLDEEALFYLQSRGISKDSARAMLLYAFAAETLEPVKEVNLKAYLDQLIADRLHKNF